MSFLELSLYVYEKPALMAEDFPVGKRKAILKSNLILLCAIAVLYVYFSGTIVSDNLKNIQLEKQYQNESRELNKTEAALISANTTLNPEYLASKGFEETKNLNVIKRNINVAENSKFNYYQ